MVRKHHNNRCTGVTAKTFWVATMKQPNTSAFDDLLDGFKYQDTKNVLRKLRRFKVDGPSKLHVVSDFDLTLTSGKRPGQNLGTWDVMDALMPPEGVARHAAIYQSLRPIELAGQLTEAVAREKWSETLDLITSYPMTMADIETAFLSVASMRPGAKALFDYCEIHAIPTVVLSAGIRNVIEVMAAHYGFHPSYILSNALVIDETGGVAGWDKDSLVHVLNKHEIAHSDIQKLHSSRPNILLLGDVTDDVNMVAGEDDVIRIRVLDPRKGEPYSLRAALRTSFAAGYDLATEHSLNPVVSLLQQIT